MYQVLCWKGIFEILLQKNCCNFPLKFCGTRVFGDVAQTQKFQDFWCPNVTQCTNLCYIRRVCDLWEIKYILVLLYDELKLNVLLKSIDDPIFFWNSLIWTLFWNSTFIFFHINFFWMSIETVSFKKYIISSTHFFIYFLLWCST